jgi:hypothetical protein
MEVVCLGQDAEATCDASPSSREGGVRKCWKGRESFENEAKRCPVLSPLF